MDGVAQPLRGRVPAAALLLVGVVALLAASVAAGHGMRVAGALTLAVAVIILAARSLVRWHVVVGLIVGVAMFIPIRRYQFASGLPFDLEPYRILLSIVGCLWIAHLLADPKVRLRRSGFEGPLGLFLLAILGSIVTNMDGLQHRDSFILLGSTFVHEDLAVDVLKSLAFLMSFYVTIYLVVSVIRSEWAINAVLKTLVGCATVVAFFAMIEARTHYNVFDHLQGVLPASQFGGSLTEANIGRGGRLRVYASAQHPIALANVLVMLMPIAIYLLHYTRQRIWAVSVLLIGLAALSTVSRTSITTMAAELVVFLWLRRQSVKKLWPLVLPALLVVHIALPGTIGGIRQAFFPSQGLISDQTKFEGRVSADRLNPQFAIIKANPAFGKGYGTRITEATVRQNAQVLDDQWLGTAVETGLVGVAAWVWLFFRFIRRAGKEAKRDLSARGWLLTSLAASVAAFAVGMATYDAFSFIQVTLVVFILIALGACTLATPGPWGSVGGAVPPPPARFRRSARDGP